MKYRSVYAVYKDDEKLIEGNAKEVANFLGIFFFNPSFVIYFPIKPWGQIPQNTLPIVLKDKTIKKDQNKLQKRAVVNKFSSFVG